MHIYYIHYTESAPESEDALLEALHRKYGDAPGLAAKQAAEAEVAKVAKEAEGESPTSVAQEVSSSVVPPPPEAVQELQRQQTEIMSMLKSQMVRQMAHQQQMDVVTHRTRTIERKQSVSEATSLQAVQSMEEKHVLAAADKPDQVTQDLTVFVAHNSAPELPKTALVVNTSATGLQVRQHTSYSIIHHTVSYTTH
jgi:hypothetical protein